MGTASGWDIPTAEEATDVVDEESEDASYAPVHVAYATG